MRQDGGVWGLWQLWDNSRSRSRGSAAQVPQRGPELCILEKGSLFHFEVGDEGMDAIYVPDLAKCHHVSSGRGLWPGSFPGASPLLEGVLLWPAPAPGAAGEVAGSRLTLLLTEAWEEPILHQGRCLRSVSGSFGGWGHLGRGPPAHQRVKGALPLVAPFRRGRQGQDAARSSER